MSCGVTYWNSGDEWVAECAPCSYRASADSRMVAVLIVQAHVDLMHHQRLLDEIDKHKAKIQRQASEITRLSEQLNSTELSKKTKAKIDKLKARVETDAMAINRLRQTNNDLLNKLNHDEHYDYASIVNDRDMWISKCHLLLEDMKLAAAQCTCDANLDQEKKK